MKPGGAGRPAPAPAAAPASAGLREFLRGCRPDWREAELEVVLGKLSRVGVHKLPDIIERLRAGDLNERLGCAGFRRLSAETLGRLRAGAGLGPAGGAEERRPQVDVEADKAQPVDPDEETGATECAICYEPVRQVAELPCACKVDYCMQCWDRALSQSFQKCSMARCPTCRSPVRVDFNPREDRLIFSRETECLEEDDDGRESAVVDYFERTLTRLTDQVRPAQIRLLRAYGASQCAEAQGLGRGAPSYHSMGYREDSEALCAAVERRVAEGLEGPKCVCGGRLKRVRAEERAALGPQDRGRLELAATVSEVGRIFAELLQRQGLTNVICDLCEEEVPVTSSVWMCENGDRTIKHATEYDICDACFASCIS